MNDFSIPQDELLALEEVENAAPKTTLSIKEALEEFSADNAQTNIIVVGSIHKVFEKVVGSEVIKHVHVKHIRDGVLFLEADHAAWAKQIKFISSTIIFGINEELGEGSIVNVEVSIGAAR